MDIAPNEIPLSAHEIRVRQMQRLFGQHIPDRPAVPCGDRLLSQMRMVFEEVLESIYEAGLEIVPSMKNGKETFVLEWRRISSGEGDGSIDLPKLMKELADVSVTLTGMFSACGVKMGPILEAVDCNNIEKKANGRMNPQTGKWEKHPNHQPPNIATLLLLQGWRQTTLD